MKRPWQIAMVFLLCLAVAMPAIGWLTLNVLKLDRAEALARRQAAVDENVNLALWRMDTLLAPILAQEATRPPIAFHPFHTVTSTGAAGPATVSVPSPLFRRPSEYVRLYFQVSRDNRWTSPQAPQGEARKQVVRFPIDTSHLAEGDALLRQLEHGLTFEAILDHVPPEMLPSFGQEALAWSEKAREEQFANAPVVANAYGYEQQLTAPSLQGGKGQQAGEFQQAAQASEEIRPTKSGPPREDEFSRRNRAFQTYAQQQVIDQRLNASVESPRAVVVREGVSRPFWVGDKLLLARRVQWGDELVVQGCWLDWEAIQQRLRAEVADLLPEFDFQPLAETNRLTPNHVLATLPVQLAVPAAVVNEQAWSPIQLALWIAWSCLLAAALATAALLWGVVALSERRAAFVAAVTHELRTPLTTFRLYAEMLSQNMAPAEKRQEYLETLQIEADRLTHLVDNVLAYARLERGARNGRKAPIALGELLARETSRLGDRAAQADMELVVSIDESAAGAVVVTDPQAVSQILFNLVDNAAKYAAGADNRRVELSCRVDSKTSHLRVCDHGPGLTSQQRRRLFQPFSKTVEEAAVTAPGVGLGLALSRRLAQELGGRLEYEAAGGAGACFVLTLPVYVSR